MPDSLELFWPIFQALQARTEALPNPDPSFPFGTLGDDEIKPANQGTPENIFGNGGDDIIYGLGGKDIIQGDFVSFRDRRILSNWMSYDYGNDIIFGEDGDQDGDLFDSALGAASFGDDDNIFADLGNDWVFGEAGNDQIWGGPRRGDFGAVYKAGIRDLDRIYGGVGDDYLVGGYDHDIVVGGRDNDTIIGSSQNGGIHAWDGVDILWGDEEGGTGNTGTDLFVLGAQGERYYDDLVDVSNGRIQFAVIKDLNLSVGDRIQLAHLPAPKPLASPPRYIFDDSGTLGSHSIVSSVNGVALDPNAQGTAIYFYSGIHYSAATPYVAPELIAFVEGVSAQALESSGIIYS